jgi:hypothetical protein
MPRSTGHANKPMPGGRVFVAWTAFQRRVESIGTELEMSLLWLPVSKKNRFLKLSSYISCMVRAFSALWRAAPSEIWVQVPQVPALYPALLVRGLMRRPPVVVADCHNAMFRRPWTAWPFAFAVLNRCDAVVAHNAAVARTAVELGIRPEKLWVVEDPPARFEALPIYRASRPDGPTLLFPASYSKDEPVEALVELARATPEVTYMFSGSREKFEARTAELDVPRNVSPTGFLSLREFDSLLHAVDGVVALTTLSDCQLSACGEAVGAGKPMILSDTPVLREQFPVGAIHINVADSGTAARQVREFFANLETLRTQIEVMRDEKRREWHAMRVAPLRVSLTSKERDGESIRGGG